MTPNYPNHPKFPHFVFLYIFVVGGERETLNLVGRLIVGSPSQRMTKHPWKGRGQSCEPFKLWWAPTMSLERLKLEWSNFVHR